MRVRVRHHGATTSQAFVSLLSRNSENTGHVAQELVRAILSEQLQSRAISYTKGTGSHTNALNCAVAASEACVACCKALPGLARRGCKSETNASCMHQPMYPRHLLSAKASTKPRSLAKAQIAQNPGCCNSA